MLAISSSLPRGKSEAEIRSTTSDATQGVFCRGSTFAKARGKTFFSPIPYKMRLELISEIKVVFVVENRAMIPKPAAAFFETERAADIRGAGLSAKLFKSMSASTLKLTRI